MLPKILLVGGTGYLGRTFKSTLQENYDVYVTGTKPSSSHKYFHLDFRDNLTFRNLEGNDFDLVIVLAASVSGVGNINLNHQDLEVNAWGYKHFLQYFTASQLAPRMVYISSMTVYDASNVIPVKEDGLIDPLSVYGLSKSIAEQLTAFVSKRNGVECVVLRIPGVFGGDRKRGFVFNTFQKCIAGEPIILDTTNLGYWECMEINDLSQLFFKFLQNYKWRKVFDVFNMSYGEETDLVQTAYKIKTLTRSSSHIIEPDEKGYVPFYLSNKKLKSIISIECTFNSALERYVQSLTI